MSVERKNLLLGNGINIKYAPDYYKPAAIRQRFQAVLQASGPFYKALFSLPIDTGIIKELDLLPEGANIETVVASMFSTIKSKVCSSGVLDSDNLDRRINAALKISALTAIFFDEGRFLEVTVPPEDADTLNSYDKVFTLNYYEFWNPAVDCIYLHGSMRELLLTVPQTSTIPVMFFDQSRYQASQMQPERSTYYRTVDDMKHSFAMYPVVEGRYLFSPAKTDKLNTASLYPSDRLFPEWDLFPAPDHSKDYEPIERLDSLVIFGVSPYGDDRLISAIDKVENLTVCIHDLKRNHKEKDAWASLLVSRKANFIDSEAFWTLL